MIPPNVAVIYDLVTYTPLRVYVNEDHEDGAHMNTIQPGPNEGVSVVSKAEVRGLQLHDIARIAIFKKTGITI